LAVKNLKSNLGRNALYRTSIRPHRVDDTTSRWSTRQRRQCHRNRCPLSACAVFTCYESSVLLYWGGRIGLKTQQKKRRRARDKERGERGGGRGGVRGGLWERARRQGGEGGNEAAVYPFNVGVQPEDLGGIGWAGTVHHFGGKCLNPKDHV
jgi:hypothetical protein